MAMNPEDYLESFYPQDRVLEKVAERIRERGMPEISVAPGYGRLLTMLVRMVGAKRVLEIGALGGYSGICLARGLNEDGRVTSLELKEEFAEAARQHVEEAGYGERIRYRIGDAIDSLRQLEEEGQRFDFFFIDADKGNYPNYLDWAIRLANPGAMICGDNLFLRGRALDPAKDSPSVMAVREFSRRIASDPRLEGVLLPAYDGMSLARVKP